MYTQCPNCNTALQQAFWKELQTIKKYTYFCTQFETAAPSTVFADSNLVFKYTQALEKAGVRPSGISQIMTNLLKSNRGRWVGETIVIV